MLKTAAIAYYGSQANLARALGIKSQSITDWGENVPDLQQLKLERMTAGELKADPSILATPAGQAAA